MTLTKHAISSMLEAEVGIEQHYEVAVTKIKQKGVYITCTISDGEDENKSIIEINSPHKDISKVQNNKQPIVIIITEHKCHQI
jgi:hypothetical protein